MFGFKLHVPGAVVSDLKLSIFAYWRDDCAVHLAARIGEAFHCCQKRIDGAVLFIKDV